MPCFDRYIGIDYSGAATTTSSLKRLRVYLADRSAIMEVYPSLWSRDFPREDRTQDQHDAYSVAAWLRQADLGGSLARYLSPILSPAERTVVQVEGWIFGVS